MSADLFCIELDDQVTKLVHAMNSLPGIKTVESCCGHEKGVLCIWFKAESLDALPDLLYWFDGCHTGVFGWVVEVVTDCAMHSVTFCAHSNAVGNQAYCEANIIAEAINRYVRENDN
jgi:hypothetical protein